MQVSCQCGGTVGWAWHKGCKGGRRVKLMQAVWHECCIKNLIWHCYCIKNADFGRVVPCFDKILMEIVSK